MEDPEKKSPNKWLALINIPFQMGIIIFAFAYLGIWLDEKYCHSEKFYVKITTIVGVAIALYNVHRQVQEINKNQK